MGEYAPSAIYSLFNAIKAGTPSAVLSGIIGDRAHTYGYHRCRAVLPAGDYSRALPLDRGGDPNAAAALDVSLPAGLMVTVTNRLLNAARARDPRLKALREFCGTTDNRVTHNYDLAAGREATDEWDDSHLWHIHLSIYRSYVNDAKALQGIADVINGKPAAPVVLPRVALTGKDRKAAPLRMNPGDVLYSADRTHRAIMQTDGNFVVRNGANATWNTHTAGNPGAFMQLQSDGNFVLYGRGNRVLWASNTAGRGGAVLVMQNDGNLVVYPKVGGSVWNTGTAGR